MIKKMAGFAALDHIAEFQDGKKCPVQLMVMGCDKFKGKGFDAFLMSQDVGLPGGPRANLSGVPVSGRGH